VALPMVQCKCSRALKIYVQRSHQPSSQRLANVCARAYSSLASPTSHHRPASHHRSNDRTLALALSTKPYQEVNPARVAWFHRFLRSKAHAMYLGSDRTVAQAVFSSAACPMCVRSDKRACEGLQGSVDGVAFATGVEALVACG
jgi:hypothetical protein